MKITRFQANGIFSCGEIDLDLKDRGLVLVTGYSKDEGSSNGAGKSSVANKGIIWTLFGVTAGGLRGDGVTNRHLAGSKKQVFGEVTIESGDNVCYTIRRERPSSLKLFLADTEISGKTAADTQEQINRILGFDYKTFIQTSFFGQGRTLSYASLTPKGQKEVLESILPMEEVDKWAKYATDQWKLVSVEAAKVDKLASAAFTRLTTLKEEHENVKRYAEQFELDRQDKVEHAVQQANLVDTRYDGTRFKLQKELECYNGLDKPEIDQEFSNRKAKFQTELEINDDVLKSAHHSLSGWTTQRNAYLKQQQELDQGLECPVCLRPFEGSRSKEDHEEAHKLIAAKIDEATINVSLATEAVNHYTKEYHRLSEAISNTQVQVIELGKMRKEKAEIEHKIAMLDQKREAEKQRFLEEAEYHRNKQNAYSDQLEGFIGKVALAEAEVESTNKTLAKLNGELEHLKYWSNVYSRELKLKLFEEACPFLDARVNYHLKRLNNEQIYVQFSTIKRLANGAAKEEFNVHVQSKTGGLGFEALSGGEQQMVSFAIGLGLADLAARTAAGRSDFLILDEPFVELDARNIDSIVTYLNSEVNQGKSTILLISNDENLKGLIPERVHVVKEGGVTTIEE